MAVRSARMVRCICRFYRGGKPVPAGLCRCDHRTSDAAGPLWHSVGEARSCGGMGMSLHIPDSVLQGLGIPEEEIAQRLRTELALALYAQGALSLGKAAELAEMNRMAFGEFGVTARDCTALWRRGVGARRLPMLVASDTSPISNLAITGRLNLLRSQFRRSGFPALSRLNSINSRIPRRGRRSNGHSRTGRNWSWGLSSLSPK